MVAIRELRSYIQEMLLEINHKRPRLISMNDVKVGDEIDVYFESDKGQERGARWERVDKMSRDTSGNVTVIYAGNEWQGYHEIERFDYEPVDKKVLVRR